MRRYLVPASLILIGFLTWFTVSTLISPPSTAKSSTQEPALPIEDSTVVWAPQLKISPPRVAPERVVVHASADLLTKRHPKHLVWRLQVRRFPDGEIPEAMVVDRVYDDQRFTVPIGVRLTPEFDEIVPLPPGRYTFGVSLLYQVFDEQGEYSPQIGQTSVKNTSRPVLIPSP